MNKADKNFNINTKTMEKETSTMEKVYNGLVIFAELIYLIIRILIEVIISFVKLFVPSTEQPVNGEIVLVTGAGHGIGRELSLQYASLGATVVCWDLMKETNEKTVTEIKAKGGKAFGYQCDVTNREGVLELAKKVKEEVGDVTILVNNAGIMPCHPLLEHTDKEIRKMFDLNIIAHFWMLEAFLPAMLEMNHGHIIGLSSMAGVSGLTNLVPYCATKFAVRGLMEAMSEELRELRPGHQIKFTTIYPYMVDTGLCKNPKIRFPSLLPLLKPEDVASFIIKSQRTGVEETTIPSYMLNMNYFFRCLPRNCGKWIMDFGSTGVLSDKL